MLLSLCKHSSSKIRKGKQDNFMASPVDHFYGKLELIKWELTYACNLKCMHCLVDAGEPDPHEINKKSLIIKVAKKISSFEPSTVLLSGGEPFLSKHLFLIIKELKEYDIFVDIESNGALIDAKTVGLLRQLECDFVCLNFQGAKPFTHDKFVGVKGAWARTQKALIELTRGSIDTGVLLVVTNFNIYDVDNIIESAISQNTKIIFINEGFPLGRAYVNRRVIFPQQSQLEKLQDYLYDKYGDLIKNERLVLNIGRIEEFKEYAKSINRKFVIKPNGKVRISDALPIIIGNFLKDTPQALWCKVNKTLTNPLVTDFVNGLQEMDDVMRLKTLEKSFSLDNRILNW